MGYTISKVFEFAASHRLNGLPDEHQCSRLHGHNYKVQLEVSADTLDWRGFVVDYGDLAEFGQWIKHNLEHQHLNEQLAFNPTAELLAEHLAGVAWREVLALREARMARNLRWRVGVSETDKTWAWSPMGHTPDPPAGLFEGGMSEETAMVEVLDGAGAVVSTHGEGGPA